jgi:enoyl-CoA hydratase/carnithine racemase
MGYEQLNYVREGKVARVTLNRPDVLNALSIELYTELGDALIEANADSQVQVVIITGSGTAFSTGGDLKQGDKVNRDDPARFAQASNRMLKGIISSDKVVIARVNGITQAGGLLIVAAADIAVASDRATFKCPEALVGLWEPYSPALLLPALGMKRAKYLLLTSETIDSTEAERIGLVNAVAPHQELDRVVDGVVDKVLKGGPAALREFKRMLNRSIPDFDTGIVVEALSSEEGREGVAAFAEKRRPKWRQ